MKWYDFFSNFYDSSLERLYRESRVQAIDRLDLDKDSVVLDVACGTGANFEHIISGEVDAKLYGTDASVGMLEKGRKLIEAKQWNATLFQSDARELNSSTISKQLGHAPSFDRIICFLGLSVIPEWEQVLDNLIELLSDGGRIVIVDVFAEKRTLNTWMVEKIAQADLNRPIWQTLETKISNFSVDYAPVKESKVGGKLFIASGIK